MANQSFPTKTTNMSKPKVVTKTTTKSTATQSFPQPIAKQTYANAPQYTPAVGVGAKSNGYTYTNQGWVSSTAPSALTKTSTGTTGVNKTSGTSSGGGSSRTVNDIVTSSASNLRTNTNISSPAAGTTINSTGGGSTLSSVINTNTLAGNNQKMDLTGTNPDEYVKDSSAFAITVPQEETELQKQQKESDSILKKMMDSMSDVPDTAAIDRKLRNQLQIEQKQQAVNDLTGQLNAIVNKGQAQQLAQVGQGRGIPEAIIGGIQAQIGRETAIAALPVQAQLQAAQGNLEMANDSLDRLFKIYSDDATNRYNAKNKMFEVAYGIADKKEQRLLDEQSKLNDRAYAETQALNDERLSYSKMAFTNGQSSLGAKIAALDYKSPTFKQDLAKLTSQLRDPMRDLDIALKNAQIDNQRAETAKTKAEGTGTTEQSSYQIERQGRILQSVDELMSQVNNKTVGAGALAAIIPGSDAKYFKTQVDSLVANITFGELTAMREASKTGGALGQVSDREGALLGAALGAIADRTITPEQYKIQLQKVKDSITRWNQAGGAVVADDTDKYFEQSTGAVVSTVANKEKSFLQTYMERNK